MPTAPVNENGAVLYYEDTGPVEGQKSYVTLVMFHGLIFHGATFKWLMPLAKNYGLRLIFANWRDYPGSTPYSEFEVEAFKNSDVEKQRAALQAQGCQIAKFLEYLVETQSIPPLQREEGTRKGGLSVLAWSLGNIILLPFLGQAHQLEERTQKLLERHLRSVILFDPPLYVLGRSLPDSAYLPFRDPAIKPEALPEAFTVWASTHYPAIPDVENLTEADISAQNHKGDPKRLATILEMSPTERAEITDLGVLARSAGLYMTLDSDVYWQNFLGAVFDTKGVWPDMDVVFFWCDRSVPDCVWGAKVIAHAIKEYGTKPIGIARRTTQCKINEANHFVHVHEPERMMQLLSENV